MKKLIMYQLNSPGQKYESILNYIKKYNYIKVMNSIYCIKTNYNVNKISDDLRCLIDKNDWLLVIEYNPNIQGWLPKSVCEFLKN